MSSTRNTADPDPLVVDPRAAEAARAERSSDAHDPKAKASWFDLLSSLSDEELARYGDIARDQELIEGRLRGLQLVSVALGTVLLIGAGVAYSSGASIGSAILLAGVGMAAEYWPYRKAKARRLWASHVRAVEDEQARRAARLAEAGDV